jgi:hypothetical protein
MIFTIFLKLINIKYFPSSSDLGEDNLLVDGGWRMEDGGWRLKD